MTGNKSFFLDNQEYDGGFVAFAGSSKGDQHNMVACLEKSDDNTEFHHIVDFLSSCSITYALTGIDTSGRPRRQETMGGTSAQTRSKRVLEQPNEPPLTEGYTSGSREGRLKENIELTDTVPTPFDLPLRGDYTPGSDEAVYNKAFITLANSVKKLESQLKQKRSRVVIHSSDEEGPSVHIEDSPKQGRIIEEMDKDENINLFKEARQEHERYNLEKSLELQRQLDQRKENVPKCDQAKEIDWNDPQVLRYHALQNKPFSKAKVRKNMIMYLKNQGGYKKSYFKRMKYEDIRPLFEWIWDQVHTFVPKDSEIERKVMKRCRSQSE
nr:hypothetical protein [Tanacetum cinerariifolium]